MNPAVPLPDGASTERTSAADGPCLRDLAPGSVGIVRSVRVGSDLRRRLLELGFVSGTRVRVVRLAPFGDPMEVELHGYHLSLRRAEAESISVERV